MDPVEPELHINGAIRLVFAKDQPPYRPLPASVDSQGTVVTEWEPTAEELQRLLDGGRIRLWLLYTGVLRGEKFTPVKLEVTEPECNSVAVP